ncbi:MAG: glycosyltransferase family 4 protein, partial [Bacteroidetes bacterium]|nr:glycosyltransferase family 4 protein [Bacteroidota bacterium]
FDSLNILLFFLDHQKWNTRTIPSTNNGNGNNKNQPQQRKSIKSLFGVLFRVIIELVPMTVKTMGFIRRLHIDIIHTNTRIGSNQHGILAGWLTGIPGISHERWWTPDTWLNRRLIEVPKVIICVSDAIKSNILEIGSVESKCRVIFNGRKLPALSGTGNKYSKVDVNKFAVGFMSNISEYKGHTVFVKGAIELLKKYPEMEFHIYGSTETAESQYLEFLKDLIDRAGFTDKIQFMGYVREVNTVIQGFHLNCCLTIGDEPLSGTIIEGFLNRTVVMATKTGGSPELITHGENGWLIEPNSVEAFMNAVENLYQSPTLMKKLANNGFEFALQNLTDESYVNNVQQVYEDVLSAQG